MTIAQNTYGSVDIQFDYFPHNSRNVKLTTNILALPTFELKTDDSTWHVLAVRIATKTTSTITYFTCSTELDGVTIDKAHYPVSTNYSYQKQHVRIFIHNQDISIYVGGKWVYSNILGFVDYPTDQVECTLSVHGGTRTLYNIKRVELHDYRDAVYVDYEATADSAIQSVIQERPVQIFSEPERLLSFTYHCIKDVIEAHHVKEFQDSIVNNSNMSSDGLIYYTNVSINTSQFTADEVGLVTRLYRLSNLETGAVRATQILQELALERRYPISVTLRFDPRLVIADQLNVDVILTGTGRHIEVSCIIEDISKSLQDGEYAMTIRGRTLKENYV